MTPEKMELLKQMQDSVEKLLPLPIQPPNEINTEILCRQVRKVLDKAYQEGRISRVPEVTVRFIEETRSAEIFIGEFEE